jgi:hypothetical protein
MKNHVAILFALDVIWQCSAINNACRMVSGGYVSRIVLLQGEDNERESGGNREREVRGVDQSGSGGSRRRRRGTGGE